MVAETSDVQGILGDEYFLLPDYRNSQFGDQAYTIVNMILDHKILSQNHNKNLLTMISLV